MGDLDDRHNAFRKKQNENIRKILITMVGLAFGFFLGVSFSSLKRTLPSVVSPDIIHMQTPINSSKIKSEEIWVPSNPRGAERLVPGIVVPNSDLYLRRSHGEPTEELGIKPKYLATFTVGHKQRHNIDAAVKKFSENFTILLFHYDNRASEWDEYEWSTKAIHVSAQKQSKWWFAKRFLHPDIVAAYDYIFIWDEDLGVESFNAEEYIKLVKKHGLEISQPALSSGKEPSWKITARREDLEVHKRIEDESEYCKDPHLPPCAAFVEIMAPVFSRDAWRCVWHMIQNEFVHQWGLDFLLQMCVEPAHEKIGVVDAQWISHQHLPSLVDLEQAEHGKIPLKDMRMQVRLRSLSELTMFRKVVANAEKDYYKSMGMDPSNIPHHSNLNYTI